MLNKAVVSTACLFLVSSCMPAHDVAEANRLDAEKNQVVLWINTPGGGTAYCEYGQLVRRCGSDRISFQILGNLVYSHPITGNDSPVFLLIGDKVHDYPSQGYPRFIRSL
mgnify:CR=1 FL=1